jgi:hypothetical protein
VLAANDASARKATLRASVMHCRRPYAGHLARMSLTGIFRNNVEDCTFLAERSEDDETKLTFKRMEAACVPWPTNRSGWTSKDGNQKRRPIEMAISAGNFLLDSLL